MKRALLSIGGTVVGLVALLDFKSHGSGGFAPVSLPHAPTPSTQATPSTQVPPAATTHAPGKKPATSTTAATNVARKVSGDPVQTNYGVVQVSVAMTGSHIDNVSFLQLSAYDGTSQYINSQAAPILVQETIAKQSAQIDTVSGASYTSAGYVQSLQSALDRARAK